MSKNLTRKGLALGAILALGSSLFAGTAANAADEVTLAPSAGTAYKTIEGETFSLIAGLAPAVPAGNVVQLKHQIVTTATLTVYADTTAAGTTAATAATATQPTNTYVYKKATAPVVGNANYLNIKVTSAVAAGTPATAVVTSFVDSNNNDVLDAGEYTSAARTVTWIDAADIKATVTLTQPSEGDTTVAAKIVLTDLNQEQISNAHLAAYATNGAGVAAIAGTNPSVAVVGTGIAGNSLVSASALASGAYPVSVAVSGGLGSTGGVAVAVYYLATGTAATDFVDSTATFTAANFTTSKLLGTKVASTVLAITARTIATVKAYAEASANNAAAAGTNNADSSIAVRSNSPFTVKALVSNATPAAVASVPVTAAVTVGSAVTLSSTQTVTINGTTYSTNASLPTAVALTSDASGLVKVDVTTAGFPTTTTANVSVKVTFTAQGYSSGVTATPTTIAYDLYEDGAISSSVERSTISGSAIAMGYTLVDQFKQVPASGNYRLVATATAGAGVTAGATYVNFSAGKASVSYTPSTTGSFTVAPTVEVQNASTLNWGAQSLNSTAATATVNSIAAQTDAVTATVAYDYAATARTSADVASAAEKALDSRLVAGTVATYTDGEVAEINGTVSQAVTAIARKGASVKVSGTGLLFSNGTLEQTTNANDTYSAGTVFAADSITVYADASGNYTVSALSNVAGTFTITVTSGNATKTVDVKFASTLAAASVTIGALDAQAQSGRAIPVSATVADKYGNPVSTSNVTFTVAGVGYLQDTAALTPVSGVVTTRLVVLGGDMGTATLTAKITVSAVDYTSVKSMEFGITDVTDISSAGKAIYVNTEFAKGKVVTVYINGVRMPVKAAEATDNAVERKYTQRKAGTYTVTVRVSGGVVASEKIVIK